MSSSRLLRGLGIGTLALAPLLWMACDGAVEVTDTLRVDAQSTTQPTTQSSTQPAALRQIELPDLLREVSGLATSGTHSVLAVADESAVIVEIDVDRARVLRKFALGRPTLIGDFEGIEVVTADVYLMTSAGTLFRAGAAAAARAKVTKIDTGLKGYCEFEGLGYDLRSARLYLLCKEITKRKGDRDHNQHRKQSLQLYAFDPQTGQRDPAADRRLDLATLFAALGIDQFRASAVVFNPLRAEMLVVAARQRAFAVFADDGRLLRQGKLPAAGHHRQTEGLALLPDGRLLLADEGGKGRARLTVYPSSW